MQTTTTAERRQAFAQELYDSFVTATRTDGTTYVTCPEDSPARELVRHIHFTVFDGMSPNDWVYKTTASILQAFAEDDDVDADPLIDVYTSDLLNWVGQSVYFRSLADEALEWFTNGSFSDLLMTAQGLGIQQMIDCIDASLTANY